MVREWEGGGENKIRELYPFESVGKPYAHLWLFIFSYDAALQLEYNIPIIIIIVTGAINCHDRANTADIGSYKYYSIMLVSILLYSVTEYWKYRHLVREYDIIIIYIVLCTS